MGALGDFNVLGLSERALTSLDIDPARDDFAIQQNSVPILNIMLKSSD